MVQVETPTKLLVNPLADLASLGKWLWRRSLAGRCFLIFFGIPLLWSLLWGIAGVIVGADKVDSPGFPLINWGLMIHFPVILAVAKLVDFFPLSAGNDAFEVFMLAVFTLPSCLFYGLVGWLLGKAISLKRG